MSNQEVLDQYGDTTTNPLGYIREQPYIPWSDEYQVEYKYWYKSIILYEVYIRAFCDGSGDGKGDIRGLISKLDHLQRLGVNCIWICPHYPSPLRDDGYDVSDYCDVHPDYGTLKDVQRLINAAHERSLKIIFDLIPNHTSDQHYWFQEARKSRDNPYRDYYVWSDTPDKYVDARIIFLDVESSNWTWDPVAGQYYWHRFYKSQPDLNFENPVVQDEILNVVKFWMDMGVDGFRVDAVPYLFEEEGTNCENLPQTHEFLKKMRKYIDDHYPGRIMLSEACQLPHQVREYFGDGDEFHLGFHFPIMPHIFMAIGSKDYSSLKRVLEETPEIPKECQWVTFLRNHDELSLEMVTPQERQWLWEHYSPEPRMRINLGIRRRLAPLFDNDRRKVELAHSMLLTMPGTPILYYGDEIGMGDNIWLEDRNGVRTPMQWTNTTEQDPTGGFSTNPKIALYAPLVSDPEYDNSRVNVQDSEKDFSSLLNVLRHLIHLRKHHVSFAYGKLIWLYPRGQENISVMSYIRHYGYESLLIISNLSDKKQYVQYDVPDSPALADKMTSFKDVICGVRYPVENGILLVDLDPYQFLWLNMKEPVFNY